MNQTAHHNNSRGGTGFSLIEVLIAVLVLGVGLLGLASVFPVVISQQRDATDVIRGGVASAAIRDQIRANPDIANELLSQDGYADADEPDADGDRVPNEGFAGPDNDATNAGGEEPVFGMDPSFNPAAPNIGTSGNGRFNPLTGFSYLWEADWDWSVDVSVQDGPYAARIGTNLLTAYLGDGGIRFRDPQERATLPNTQPDLPVQARLFPRPYSAHTGLGDTAQDGPEYVWDFVPRRQPSGDVQIVVFVRRISTGIRVGAGQTLSSLLRDGANGVFPVSRDQTTGVPTTDGSGEYAVPMSAKAIPVPARDYPSRPEYRGSADPDSEVLSDGIRIVAMIDPQVSTAGRLEDIEPLAAVGQKFVDNLGVVRTVVEVLAVNEAGDSVDVRVEPALVRNAIVPAFDGVPAIPFSQKEAARIGKLRQIVFTPQVPVDVFTMEFSK